MSVSEHANYLLNEYGRLQFDYAAYCKPYGESLRNEARNNLEEYIAELENEVNSVVKKTVTLENKNRNLHKVIAKQQVKIQRQAENLTILLDLYTSGKRSKSHKKLREKYRLLKASFNEWKRG
jgi:predicted PilT family ATPase